MPGVAISVALIPPLAVIGIGLAYWDWEVMSRAFVLFLINIGGIIFASMLVFSLMNFYVRRKVAQISIVKDEIEIEQSKAKAKQAKETKENNEENQKIIVKNKNKEKDQGEDKSNYHLEVDLRDTLRQKEKSKDNFVVNSLED